MLWLCGSGYELWYQVDELIKTKRKEMCHLKMKPILYWIVDLWIRLIGTTKYDGSHIETDVGTKSDQWKWYIFDICLLFDTWIQIFFFIFEQSTKFKNLLSKHIYIWWNFAKRIHNICDMYSQYELKFDSKWKFRISCSYTTLEKDTDREKNIPKFCELK